MHEGRWGGVRIRVTSACGLAILGGSGCGGSGVAGRDVDRPAAPSVPARINHVVFFDLKDPADADALVSDSRRSLGSIPAVVSLFCGKHVDSGRPAVLTDYDACVYVGFDSLEDYAAYVADQRHRDLVARWRDRLVGYSVYDVLDDTAP